MEDSFNSPNNKRERPLKPHNNGDDSSHDQRTPKRRLSWTDSEIISDSVVPSSALMEESEPTMTSCSGSQENLETIPGSLSGLEEKEGHVTAFCLSSEEKPKSVKVSGERDPSIDVSYDSSEELLKPISVDPLNSKETEASLSGMEPEFEFTIASSTNEEKDSKPFVDCNLSEEKDSQSESMEISLSNPQKKPESMEPSRCGLGKSTCPEMALLLSGGRKASSTSQKDKRQSLAKPFVIEFGEEDEEEEEEKGGRGGGGEGGGGVLEKLDPETIVEIKNEKDVIEMTGPGPGLYEGRPKRRLSRFSITNLMDEMVMIDHSTLESLFISGVVLPFHGSTSEKLQFRCGCFGPVQSWCTSGFFVKSLCIWVSTELADYLCEMPGASYVNCYRSFEFKASLCIQTFDKLTVDPEVEFGELLPSLVSAMLEEWPDSADSNSMSDTLKPHMAFVADQLVVLDQEFSKSRAIKTIHEAFKEDMEKIRTLRQENMVNGRKFSDNDGEKAMMEASSSQTYLEEEKHRLPTKRSLPTYIENQEKNIEKVKKAAMDTRKIEEGIRVNNDELVAVYMTGTKGIEILLAQRQLKGFKMLDEGEELQPFENMEHDRLYITSEIWPSSNSEEPDLGVRCNSFGPAVSWCITGYEEGAPHIWVSTDYVDYLCRKPNADYKPFFKPFYEKAMLCIRAFHVFSASPDLEFDEFCRKLVLDILPCFDTFKDEETTWNYMNSHLGFVAEQLIRLDGIFFSERPSIKRIIEKFSVDYEKALDRKVCGSFLSLYDKNWWIRNCQSEDMNLAEIRKKQEIKVPQGQSSELSNSMIKLLQDKKKVKREEDLAKEGMKFTATMSVCKICRDYHSKKMRQEEIMDLEQPGAMEHDKTEAGKEMRKEEAMGMNQAAEVIEDESIALSMTRTESTVSQFQRLTGFTILDEKKDMHTIEDLVPNKFYISSEIRPVPAANSTAVVRCNLFGPITYWCITCYHAERPFIWVYTKVAVYECNEPSTAYLPLFKALYMKAVLCIHASQFLMRNPSGKFIELFEELVLALMAHFEIFKDRKKACTFADSHLGFIVERLIEFNMRFFSKLRAIKTMIDVCIADIREEGNTMANYPYFLIYRKNEVLHKYRSYSSANEKSKTSIGREH
ncbi:hypothetical protein AMTRI_Chr11g150170 [Amborella trichopoda]